MLHDLNIVHRPKPAVFGAIAAPVWSTCLRSLAFTSYVEEKQEGDEIYARENAYRFLLEIVCGLHSPIVGETEVFGQFKAFAEEWSKRQPERAPLIQRLLSDAKTIRADHLAGLGNQSYGSWVRRNLRDQNVHILGAGHLAQEILPYVTKIATTVTLHTRSVRGESRLISERAFDGGALIVAAPMTAREIREWMGGRVPSQIFDLRDDSSIDRIGLETQNFVLGDIFAQIEETKKRLLPVVTRVRGEIGARTEKISLHAIIRPQGWDDICA